LTCGRPLADLEPLNDVEIPLRLDALEIVEQAATSAHHLQQSTTACEVLRVLLEVVGEMRDPTREQGNLDLGRPGVGIPSPIRTDEFRFSIFRERHQPKTALLQAT